MAVIKIGGMDPSLKNFGGAHASYDFTTRLVSMDGLSIMQPDVIKNKTVRQNSKDLYVAEQLAREAMSVAQGKDVMFVEMPVGSQSARAMASYGVCIGIFAALRAMNIAVIEVTAAEVKYAATGNKNASKDDVIDAMYRKYPHLNWPMKTRLGEKLLVTSKAEHMADAVAAVEAGFQTTQFKSMLPMLERLNQSINPSETI